MSFRSYRTSLLTYVTLHLKVTKGSDRSTLVSLNRYERKKNAALAIDAFAKFRKLANDPDLLKMRLVVAGEINRCFGFHVLQRLDIQAATTRGWKIT